MQPRKACFTRLASSDHRVHHESCAREIGDSRSMFTSAIEHASSKVQAQLITPQSWMASQIDLNAVQRSLWPIIRRRLAPTEGAPRPSKRCTASFSWQIRAQRFASSSINLRSRRNAADTRPSPVFRFFVGVSPSVSPSVSTISEFNVSPRLLGAVIYAGA